MPKVVTNIAKRNVPNIGIFSFAEMTSNDNGKTSGSGTMGVIVCVIGSIGFLTGIIDKFAISHSSEIMEQSVLFCSLGAAMLGVRKWRSSVVKEFDTENAELGETDSKVDIPEQP